MKVVIVGDSSSKYMPYLDLYLRLISDLDVDYELIVWDRLHIENEASNKHIYLDKKKLVARNFFDYFKYSIFARRIIRKIKPDIIIYFGLPILLFKRLIDSNKYKYILDIRDYHQSLKFLNIRRLLKKSKLNVISSECFKNWLPKDVEYEVFHNLPDISKNIPKPDIFMNKELRIGFVGSLRDIKINKQLLGVLSQHTDFRFYYHGYSDLIDQMRLFVESKKIKNVVFTGKYDKESEVSLYNELSFTNVFLEDDINSRTLLPNRLYYSAIIGVPVLVNEGNYVSEIVKKYCLGEVIDFYQDPYAQIKSYINRFSVTEYKQGRDRFLDWVKSQNISTSLKIKKEIMNYE